jgi:hypothetical protein
MEKIRIIEYSKNLTNKMNNLEYLQSGFQFNQGDLANPVQGIG